MRFIHSRKAELLLDAIRWLDKEVRQTLVQRGRSRPLTSKPVGKRAAFNDFIEKQTGSRPLPERQTEAPDADVVKLLDRSQMERIANQYAVCDFGAGGLLLGSIDEVVGALCLRWNRPAAVPLARAWLYNDTAHLKEVNMDGKSVEVLIGIAAAAAVLALVLLARRNPSVLAAGRSVEVSADFQALQRVRDQGGPATMIARDIIDAEASPWDFALDTALEKRSASDRRILLAALAGLGVGVEVICPSRGALFVREQMSGVHFVEDGSCWVVAALPSEERRGYLLRGQTVVHAEVDACTVDWWCLALKDEDCPIAAAVREHPEQYIGVESEYAVCWSVRQGFSVFADLRARFDEVTLSSWTRRLAAHLSEWYEGSSGRRPDVIGTVGDRYDASVMRSVNGAPEGDARVIAVEERDGIPQHGYGCSGAPPLLYAVVRVMEG